MIDRILIAWSVGGVLAFLALLFDQQKFPTQKQLVIAALLCGPITTAWLAFDYLATWFHNK